MRQSMKWSRYAEKFQKGNHRRTVQADMFKPWGQREYLCHSIQWIGASIKVLNLSAYLLRFFYV